MYGCFIMYVVLRRVWLGLGDWIWIFDYGLLLRFIYFDLN
jgi:hypothetical protein